MLCARAQTFAGDKAHRSPNAPVDRLLSAIAGYTWLPANV
jgi:hypothetical protein